MSAMKSVFSAWVVAAALVASFARADGCPAAPDHSGDLQDLFAQVQAAENEMQARVITNKMWELWADAPDEPAQEMLDLGMG